MHTSCILSNGQQGATIWRQNQVYQVNLSIYLQWGKYWFPPLQMHLILRIPTKDLIFCFSLAFSQLCLHENLWVILYVLEKRKTNWKCKYFDEQLNKNRLVWHTDSTGWGLGNRSWLINYGLYLTRLKRSGKKARMEIKEVSEFLHLLWAKRFSVYNVYNALYKRYKKTKSIYN